MASKCALPKSTFPVKFKVKSPVQALELARGLIRPFKHWTTNTLATDDPEWAENGLDAPAELPVKSPEAKALCALGALLRVNTEHAKKAEGFLRLASYIVTYPEEAKEVSTVQAQDYIINVNDDEGRTKEAHRKVLKMFTLAIRLAKKAAAAK
jgi:hypothetical protein